MKLYHGTSEPIAKKALIEGLTPRFDNASNWKEHPSRQDMVYLTSCYAPFFSFQAAQDNEQCAIIETEIDPDDENLYPDEDFLAQASLMPSNLKYLDATHLKYKDLRTRTAWFKNNLEMYKELATASLENLGTCAYRGTIPANKITRVVAFDFSTTPMARAVDPTITLINFKIMNEFYKNVTRWFMGDSIQKAPLKLFGIDESTINDRTGVSTIKSTQRS